MPNTIAVAGATGRAGTHIVEILEAAGHEVVPIARSVGVDVITGEGLDLTGVDVLVDAATGPSPDQASATEFFTTAARNLLDAASRAGVSRVVVISIIGVDRYDGGYQAAKVAQERAYLEGPIPVRILRAAQFHEFVELLVQWSVRDGVAHLQEMRTQLVAARTVAEAAVALAVGDDDRELVEIAGPREESLVEVARLVHPELPVEGFVDRSDPDSVRLAAGANLPGPGATLAGPTFEAWLAARGSELPA